MNRVFKPFFILFLFFNIPLSLLGQVTPLENAQLNYRIIGFSFDDKAHFRDFTIQVAAGHYYNDDSFRKNIIITEKGRGGRTIVEVPAFGRTYTWRIVSATGRKKAAVNGPLHHFSTGMDKWVNEDSVRLRITTPATAHKGDYVFLDGNKVLYDMAGNPVWYLPELERAATEVERPRDIKITPFGTLTLLIYDQAYEVNYNGQILWKGPGPGKLKKSMDSITNLHHHELTRLSNGNYMTFGFEHALWLLPDTVDSTIAATLKGKITIEKGKDNRFYQKITFAKLVEYDSKGQLVWEWLSSDYFKQSDLYYRTLPYGIFDLDDTHGNAFYFDEKEKTILVSFRNLNRVVNIQYPTGKILNTFGKKYIPGTPHTYPDNGLFSGQHSCRKSQEGYLYLFNNNVLHPALTPTVIMMRESPAKKDSLEKVWEFICPMDELTKEEKATYVFNTGGGVYELPDKTIFCCMGSGYGKTLLVDRDKKILWCAQPEIWKNNKWSFVHEYRGSIITREELEKLIWGEPLQN